MSTRAKVTAKNARNAAPGADVIPAGRLKLVPASPEAQLAEWIDELGQLEHEMIEVRPKLTRIETLRGLIRERFAGEAPHKTFEARGARYTATLGPRAYERTLDTAALMRAIGIRAYAAIAKPTLKAVCEAVPPHISAKCITQDYIGARPLKTFPIDSGA